MSVRWCEDCKWFGRGNHGVADTCNRPEARTIFIRRDANSPTCAQIRGNVLFCGGVGRWFESKEGDENARSC